MTAIACELLATRGLPLSKFSRVELHRLVVQRGVTDASARRSGPEHYRTIARPFDWTFTRNDLDQVLAKIADREPDLRLAA